MKPNTPKKSDKTILCDCLDGTCSHPAVLMVRMETAGEPSVNYFCIKHLGVASRWINDIANAVEVDQEDV
jgi:hypothetical protein